MEEIRKLTDMDKIIIENITDIQVTIFENNSYKISYRIKNVGHYDDVYELTLKIRYKSQTNINKKFYMKVESHSSSKVIRRVNKIIDILNLLFFTNRNVQNEINNINFKLKIDCHRESNGFRS